MKHSLMKIAAIVALGAGMTFTQTSAAPAPQGSRAVKVRRVVRQRLVKALNLTEGQKQQTKAIFQQAKQEGKPIAQQIKQNRQALEAAVKAGNVPQIQSLSAQQGYLRGQLLAVRSSALAKCYSSLTPEQRVKADQIEQRLRQRLEQRKERKNG